MDYDLFEISDRREAIAKALTLAEKDDLVLITGKGAEQYICLANGKKIPWDDRRIVREELSKIKQNSLEL
jgi:UDP-N-acetylmuramyl tripeptide synthase